VGRRPPPGDAPRGAHDHRRGNYRVTAAATLVLAEALLDRARRDGLRPGCVEPQELFTLPELEDDLRRRGLAVHPVP
jgi:hypothetical protein